MAANTGYSMSLLCLHTRAAGAILRLLHRALAFLALPAQCLNLKLAMPAMARCGQGVVPGTGHHVLEGKSFISATHTPIDSRSGIWDSTRPARPHNASGSPRPHC